MIRKIDRETKGTHGRLVGAIAGFLAVVAFGSPLAGAYPVQDCTIEDNGGGNVVIRCGGGSGFAPGSTCEVTESSTGTWVTCGEGASARTWGPNCTIEDNGGGNIVIRCVN